MVYSSVIHCNNPVHHRSILQFATALNLEAKPLRYNQQGILIRGESKPHDLFTSMFEHNSDMSVFYDHGHPKTQPNVFRSHCRFREEDIVDSQQIVTPLVAYGRTATWYANYYHFPSTTASPVIAVVSFGGNYQLSDLQYYWKTVCGLSTYPTVINVGVGQSIPAFTGQGPDLENTLDLEIVGGACPTSTLIFVSAPNTFLGFYQAFSAAINGISINGTTYHPSIISCSWGAPEPTFGNGNLNSFNDLFSQAANKGITIVVATGDHGSSDGYTSNNLPNTDFPSSSPWVLAIGGTTVTSSSETVWSWNPTNKWGTGSGCSAYFNQPSWQQGFVSLPTGTNPSVSYLSGKRAVPDIALSADPSNGYTIYLNGKLLVNSVGGTSCSAPLMAGLIGLMNLRYTSAIASYLYPIYQSDQRSNCYIDITVGTNDNLPNSTGIWTASSNFDLCSGMGSINGANLFRALQQRGLSSNTVTSFAPAIQSNLVTSIPKSKQTVTSIPKSKPSMTTTSKSKPPMVTTPKSKQTVTSIPKSKPSMTTTLKSKSPLLSKTKEKSKIKPDNTGRIVSAPSSNRSHKKSKCQCEWKKYPPS